MKKKLLFSNTYDSGAITILIYKYHNEEEYTAVALQFGLAIKARTIRAARECIGDVTENYLRNVSENKLSEELLNRPAEKKYWEIYKKAIEETNKLAELSQGRSKTVSTYQPKIPFNLSLQGYQNGNFNIV